MSYIGFSFLNLLLADKSGYSTITFGEIIGHPLTDFHDLYIQKAKAISNTTDHIDKLNTLFSLFPLWFYFL